MKAFADEADKRRRQVLAAATLADEQLCWGENEHSPSATAAIVAAERVGREVAECTLRLSTLALVVEQERREAAKCALALATTALAAALKRQEAAERTSAMAILMLANVQKRQQMAERAQMSANIVRSLSSTLPHPMSYVGAILSTIEGDCQPSSQVLQSTTANEWWRRSAQWRRQLGGGSLAAAAWQWRGGVGSAVAALSATASAARR